MNLKRARYINAIYESGGVTAAAKKLFVSQPSLSQTVRLVEQEMGIAIFERGISPPKLTYAGEQYLQAARAMIAQEEQLNGILENIRNEKQGCLRLGFSIQRGLQLLPLVLPEFSRRYPDVQLILEEHGSELLEKIVGDGKIDLGLVTTEPSDSNLKYILIENESYVLLTSRGSALGSRRRPGDSVSLIELVGERFVSLKPGHNIRVIQDRVFARCGISPRILMETDSLEGAMRTAVACGCCMLCPQVFVRDAPAIAGEGVCYQVDELNEQRHFYACHQREKYLPAYTRDFIEMVQAATRESRRRGRQGAEGA
ncbi:MAG: LysR family transcriptional regulator [Butyricicoccus sp.]|nr:LysR family transcriptional regulator [Butyricicoccus sp.]